MDSRSSSTISSLSEHKSRPSSSVASRSERKFFSKRQLMAFKTKFEGYKADLYGGIPKDSLKNLIQSLKLIPCPTEEELDQMCSKESTTYQEFVDIIYYFMRSVYNGNEVQSAFKYFDRNATGTLPFALAKEILSQHSVHMTLPKVQTLQKSLKAGKDGMFDYAAFVRNLNDS